MHRFFLLLLLYPALLLRAADYDCLFIGTSPICVLEAVAQHYGGKRVLMLDEADDLGGAWRTIDICGVMHVDVGCHQIGHDPAIRDFLEQYVGCPMVHMDRPLERYDAGKLHPNGLYFAEGCHGLVQGLKGLLARTGVQVLLEHHVDAVQIEGNEAVVRCGTETFTANKVFVPTYWSMGTAGGGTKFYHLYMLIHEPEPFRFTYQGGGGNQFSRVMNLTPFSELQGSGRHLLIFQTHGEQALQQGQMLLDDLKRKQLVSMGAYILQQAPYIYEQKRSGGLTPHQRPFFEQIDTSHFSAMSSRIARWKQVIPKLN